MQLERPGAHIYLSNDTSTEKFHLILSHYFNASQTNKNRIKSRQTSLEKIDKVMRGHLKFIMIVGPFKMNGKNI